MKKFENFWSPNILHFKPIKMSATPCIHVEKPTQYNVFKCITLSKKAGKSCHKILKTQHLIKKREKVITKLEKRWEKVVTKFEKKVGKSCHKN